MKLCLSLFNSEINVKHAIRKNKNKKANKNVEVGLVNIPFLMIENTPVAAVMRLVIVNYKD